MINPENISSFLIGNPKDFLDNVSFDDENFFAKTNSQNYGKVHIINISAIWCGPCKPVLEQFVALMKEYEGKDVCVSFLCITPDNNATRNMYREKGIDDASVYFTSDDEYKFLASTFSPMGLPYGILVNRKGIIVDYGVHVRPNELLREKINTLLVQDKLIK